MINELLWVAGMKQQYDIQKASGLAGIMGFLTILLIALKWQDWFYPLFKKIGLVDIAQSLGLVRDGVPAMTVIYITLFLAACILFVGLLSIALVFGGMLLMAFGQTELGKVIIGAVFMLILLPFMLPSLIKKHRQHKQTVAEEQANGFYRPVPLQRAYEKDKELKGLLNKYKDDFENVRMFRLFEEQTKRDGDVFEKWHDSSDYLEHGLEKAKSYLNRAVASIENDREWLIGYFNHKQNAEDNKFYIYFPNPLPAYASKYFLDDCYQEGSQVCSNDYNSAPKGNELYEYHKAEISRNYPLYTQDPKRLYVPALEIEFVWDGYAVSPRVVEGAVMESVMIDNSSIFHIQTPKLTECFEEISKQDMVQQAIKEAHIAMYLIPLAYPNAHNDDAWGYTGHFKELVSQIPNANAFAPLYAADVQERIIAYANSKKEWAINWIAQDV